MITKQHRELPIRSHSFGQPSTTNSWNSIDKFSSFTKGSSTTTATLPNFVLNNDQSTSTRKSIRRSQSFRLDAVKVNHHYHQHVITSTNVKTAAITAAAVSLITAATAAAISGTINFRTVITAMVSLLSNIGSSIDTFWKAFPFAAAAITCGFKATAADIVAQRRQQQIEKLESLATQHGGKSTTTTTTTTKIDWKRTMAYLLYGSIYQGMTQEYIYNHLYPIWFGTSTAIRTVLTKVTFDVTIQTVFFTLPFAYIAKACIYQLSLRQVFQQYIEDIRYHGLMKKYVAIWAPVNCLTFSIVPVHYRVTWIACVSFLWMIILSSIASRKRTTVVPTTENVSSSSEVESLLSTTESDVIATVAPAIVNDSISVSVDEIHTAKSNLDKVPHATELSTIPSSKSRLNPNKIIVVDNAYTKNRITVKTVIQRDDDTVPVTLQGKKG